MIEKTARQNLRDALEHFARRKQSEVSDILTKSDEQIQTAHSH